MGFKGTKGEWKVEGSRAKDGVVIYANKLPIAYMSEVNGDTETNAKLIAASPNLLHENIKNVEILQWVADHRKDFNLMSDKLQLIHARISETQAAIDKAIK